MDGILKPHSYLQDSETTTEDKLEVKSPGFEVQYILLESWLCHILSTGPRLASTTLSEPQFPDIKWR